jgi:IMP dehydrogenase
MPSVADIIRGKSSPVAAVGPEDKVHSAVLVMAERRIGSVVVRSGEKVVGIFTERDVLNRVLAQDLDPKATAVRDVMSNPVACCQPATKITECKSVMTEKRLRHLPVVEEGHLVGMVSVGDILAFEAAEQAYTIEYLQEYLYGRV